MRIATSRSPILVGTYALTSPLIQTARRRWIAPGITPPNNCENTVAVPRNQPPAAIATRKGTSTWRQRRVVCYRPGETAEVVLGRTIQALNNKIKSSCRINKTGGLTLHSITSLARRRAAAIIGCRKMQFRITWKNLTRRRSKSIRVTITRSTVIMKNLYSKL